MKIVKYIFLLLLLTAIAVTVFIATQEGKYNVKKERVIKVPRAVLYNYINEYKNWETTGLIADTTATYSYSEATSGKDTFMSWEKDGTEGRISTTKLIENDSILQKATIDNLNSEIAWGFKDTIGGTKVTVRMKGELSFQEKAYSLLRGHVNDKMDASLDKSLANLNSFLVEELKNYKVEVKGPVTKTGVFYLGQSLTTNTSEIQKKAGEIFPKLMGFVKTNKMVTNGAPFILYKAFDKQLGAATYTICIPIKEEMFTAPGSEYEGGKVEAFQALKTTLKGDYSHLPKAWDAAKKHILEKGIQENTTGRYIELYSKGMQQTKRPSEWVTDIYIPTGAPVIAPEIETMEEVLPAGTPAPAQPATVTPKPATNKPATGTTTQRPAGSTPTGTASKPAMNKPATTGTQTQRPAGTTPANNANKPATNTKPAGTTSATGTTRPAAKPAPTTTPAQQKPQSNP
jgi:predicted transcriptional regulator YdeE